MWTIVLLIVSNVFMTFAWYGHLKYPRSPLLLAIMVSWGIALAEYCCQVPANRLGQTLYGMQACQLKIVQEVITLAVFSVFTVTYLGQQLRWNYLVAFGLMIAAVVFVFAFKPATA